MRGLPTRSPERHHLLPRQRQRGVLASGYPLHCRMQTWHRWERSEAVHGLPVQRRMESDRGAVQARVHAAAALVSVTHQHTQAVWQSRVVPIGPVAQVAADTASSSFKAHPCRTATATLCVRMSRTASMAAVRSHTRSVSRSVSATGGQVPRHSLQASVQAAATIVTVRVRSARHTAGFGLVRGFPGDLNFSSQRMPAQLNPTHSSAAATVFVVHI
jgi:hypothetical protein